MNSIIILLYIIYAFGEPIGEVKKNKRLDFSKEKYYFFFYLFLK